MATHEPRSMAQDVISCDLCKNPTQQYCYSCQVNLCEECVPKHEHNIQSLLHDIRDRKVQQVFSECEVHEGQRCQVQCQQCQTPICIKCCIGPHNNHDAVYITELVEIKKQEIQNDTEEIESKPILKAKTLKGEKLSMEVGKIKASLTFDSLPSNSIIASDRTDRTQLNKDSKKPIMPKSRAKGIRLPPGYRSGPFHEDHLERLMNLYFLSRTHKKIHKNTQNEHDSSDSH